MQLRFIIRQLRFLLQNLNFCDKKICKGNIPDFSNETLLFSLQNIDEIFISPTNQ